MCWIKFTKLLFVTWPKLSQFKIFGPIEESPMVLQSDSNWHQQNGNYLVQFLFYLVHPILSNIPFFFILLILPSKSLASSLSLPPPWTFNLWAKTTLPLLPPCCFVTFHQICAYHPTTTSSIVCCNHFLIT